MTRVVHLTSVHSRTDTRIFLKECRSLAIAGYDVSLIVADGKGEERKDGILIYDVGRGHGRIDRMRNVTHRIYQKSLALDADIYHFHDPELIPIGVKLKSSGKKVVFDAHEDLPKQLLSKPYLNKSIGWLLSKIFSYYEQWTCQKLDAVVTATPSINDKFIRINPLSININNFPMLGELAQERADDQHLKNHVCYVGGITQIRGIKEIVAAMELVNTSMRLQLVGQFSEPNTELELRAYEGWARVDALGFLDRVGVRDVLSRSVAGLVTFHPLPNHIDSQPNKMFEYMSAGIPVIASNFPLWREIIEGNDCGLCIDPLKPNEIAGAIDFLTINRERAREMGENGKKAVVERYNWGVEEAKLLDLYYKLIK
ncbi:glycosyltransferase family 4 protein [Pusillimonas sp. SM2304]|uniref:glycosyltransferase family 4 protein n=1 Tax=Pusillimonas sp. SM2304 TaxID=3073241 RepID=UPI002873F81F|nr:glycosyltransferase family 4 protein [Pusillimonas sp. SM2304]MDS1140047.1 glycosyltransferase family 4 protein [Pusillimonas sp. SM2304]